MKFEIKHRWDNSVLFSLECESLKLCVEAAISSRADLSRANLSGADLSDADLSGADLSGAYLSDADLSRADLSRANLSRAYLSRANLSRADLSRANLSRANLSDAYLSRANLSGADLSRANLSDAYLSGADLSDADLDSIKWDFFGRLSVWPNEADALLQAIKDGKINGSTYQGECACFVGTIANIKHCEYTDLNGLKADSSSPTEVFFTTIKEGDTPENNGASKIAAGWVETFIKHRDLARTDDRINPVNKVT